MTVWMRKVSAINGVVEVIEIMAANHGDEVEVFAWCEENIPNDKWGSMRKSSTVTNLSLFDESHAVAFRLRWAEEFNHHPLDFRVERTTVNAPSRKLKATWRLG